MKSIWNLKWKNCETRLASDTPTIKCGISGAPSCDTDVFPKQTKRIPKFPWFLIFCVDLRSLFFQGHSKIQCIYPSSSLGSKFLDNPSLQFQLGFDPSKGWSASNASLSTAVATIHHGLGNGTYLQCPKFSTCSSRMKTREIVLDYKIPDSWMKNFLFHVSTFVKSPFCTDCEGTMSGMFLWKLSCSSDKTSGVQRTMSRNHSSMQLKQIQRINNLDWKNNDLCKSRSTVRETNFNDPNKKNSPSQ